MEQWDKIMAVQKIQDYIKLKIDEDIKVDDIANAIGYSKRHIERIFKELIGKTLTEYIRSIRLTESAKTLIKSEETILHVALNTHFDSHEGFSRAFSNEFGITPLKYRQEKPPVKYFTEYPIKHYYSYLYNKEKPNMEQMNPISLCTVTIVRRPIRKLLLLRSTKAHDYWSYCEEMGCDWEGLFNSVDCRMDNAAILELPQKLITDGTTSCASGIEVPHNYECQLPEGCDCIELPECDMMYFQTEPYEHEDDFCIAIDLVSRSYQNYNPKQFGYEFAFELAPQFNFGASKEMGAKLAVPVKKSSNK